MRRSARFATLVCAAALLIAAWQARRPGVSSAAEEDQIAWGATDPTWAPDGETLAFSLFGSIWKSPAAGGTATQLSSSDGYHAHPAYSPDGKQVAFISGHTPRGRFAKIVGRLTIVDVASGEERTIKTPKPTIGTPSWSPDGKAIYVGLGDAAGVLLHRIDLASGDAEPLEARPQGNTPTMTSRESLRRLGRWMETAADPRGGEVYYAGDHMGAPQIWSLPAEPRDFKVHLPLTNYLPDDIVNLDGISALPDGGVVFAADLINAVGNFELYSVSGEGGEVRRLTETPRHEITPAVSRDGKRVAFSSNRLGNLNLFVMPVAGGDAKPVVIDALKFRKSSGTVRVKVLDELGKPTPVRLYMEAADGKAYGPRGEPMFYYPLEPGPERDGFFVASGDDAFPAPAGPLKLTAVKGFEYRISSKTVDVRGNGETEVTIQMERWTNWNQKGWYSGENHFHANYLGSYYQRPLDSLAWMEAMDLNAANMIVANAEGAFVHDKEFFTGAVSSVSTDRNFLYWGQEYRNSDPLGHMGFLNIKRQVPPSYTSVPGSDSPYDFPLNTMAAINAREQGGMVTYMHPMFPGVDDVFDTNLGAKESVVTAALGALDTLDLLPYGEPAYALWYGLLNCGVKIAAGAGTDTFTNWRGINRIPGGSRQYVDVGGKMSWDRWIERYREGRSFATNGPLLSLEVNGQGMGQEIRAGAGQTVRARVGAEVWTRTPLERIELIRNGQVIESREIPSSAKNFRLDAEVEIAESAWLAVRVSGPPAPGLTGPARAHTSPVYVSIGGQETLVREDLETAVRWVDRFWAYLVQRDNFGPDPNRAQARAMVEQARAFYVEKLGRATRP